MHAPRAMLGFDLGSVGKNSQRVLVYCMDVQDLHILTPRQGVRFLTFMQTDLMTLYTTAAERAGWPSIFPASQLCSPGEPLFQAEPHLFICKVGLVMAPAFIKRAENKQISTKP